MPKERTYGDREFDNEAKDVLVSWTEPTVEHPVVYIGVAEQTDRLASMSVPLNRAGLNRIIRALRKARDRAYGTDA
jgi:hypothetical protein